ncbi:hypothetical protein KEM54_003003 [Ascosphaera aggregata]|nr:hypothetical protein KEM54_003003 [Ascosphaera aggregata]
MGEAQEMRPIPRPPSPPRDSSFNSPVITQYDARQQAHAAAESLVPDPATPSAAIPLNSIAGVNSVSKRVEFSPAPSYIKPLAFNNGDKVTTPLRIVTPSNECKPGKSILKASHAPKTITTSTSSVSPDNATAFLKSALQELSNESRSSRIDAYVSLARTWRAYVNMPDGDTLLQAVPTISRFIRRDIVEIGVNFAPSNINLVHQALSLLLTFVWNPELSSRLPDDIKAFVIDHSIVSLQSRKLPKLLVTDYLKIISFQQLSPRCLTAGRISQILTALHSLTDLVEGKAIVSQRIAVYDKLYQQTRQPFVNQASLWIEHLVTAFFHPLEEIWKFAISLALLIAHEGASSTISKALRAVLDIPRDDGSKFVHTLCERLNSMASKRSKHVPLIWSTILLLLRSNKFSLEYWSDLKDWLLVLEKCFNANDNQIRCEAFLAWNRFIYCLLPSETLSGKTVAMLGRPIITQLDRRRADRTVMDQAAHSYNFLLYLAFHPSTSTSRLEQYWHEYILRAISNHVNRGSPINVRVCNAVAALLWNAQPKIWNERKVSDAEAIIETSDLPRLDPKWVKSRLSLILPVFESLFKHCTWNMHSLEDSKNGIAWSNLCKTLGDACSKEITPSLESMQALASIMGMFQRIWKKTPSSLAVPSDDPEIVCDVFKFLYTTLACHMGATLFTDRRLLKTSQETYQTASTPTHRHASSTKHLRAPTMHLIHMIFSHIPIPPQSHFISFFEMILETSVRSRGSTAVQLGIHRQVEEILQGFTGPKHQEHLDRASQVILKSARFTLFSSVVQKADDKYREQLEEVLNILSMAISLGSAPSEWRLTFIKLVNDAKEWSGVDAVAPMIEVLSGSAMALLGTEMKSFGIAYCTEMVQEAETVCALLSRGRYEDPDSKFDQVACFKQLHGLMNSCLLEICEGVNSVSQTSSEEFINAIMNYLDGIELQKLPDMFAPLQEGILGELKDATEFDVQGPADQRQVRKLTAKVSKLIWRILKNEPSRMHSLSPIMVGGLLSSSPATAGYFVDMWNIIFSDVSPSDCPDNIRQALSIVESRIGLSVPSLTRGAESKNQSKDIYSRLRPRKVQKKPQSTSNRRPKSAPRKGPSVRNGKRLVDDRIDPEQPTPELELLQKVLPHHLASNTPIDDTQDDSAGVEVTTTTQDEIARNKSPGVESDVGQSSKGLPTNVGNWEPTMLLHGNDNDSDVPTLSPRPGSNSQSQQSLLTPRLCSPEKQVSQTEIVEETVLGGKSPPSVPIEHSQPSPPSARNVGKEPQHFFIRLSSRKRKSPDDEDEGKEPKGPPPQKQRKTEISPTDDGREKATPRRVFWPLDRLLRLYR